MSIVSCFPKNELASGHFWAISLKAYAFSKMLNASKIYSFLGRRFSSFFKTMLRKSFHSCFPKNKLASGHFWAISLKAYAFSKMLNASKIYSFLGRRFSSFFKTMLRKSFHNHKDIQLYCSLYNIFKREFYEYC